VLRKQSVWFSHHQNAGQNHNLIIANKPFKNVAKFKYLEMTVKNKKFIEKEIKSRLNVQNPCYNLVQSLLSSPL
jgi:hypothetical protein